jgi:hypothetical protein
MTDEKKVRKGWAALKAGEPARKLLDRYWTPPDRLRPELLVSYWMRFWSVPAEAVIQNDDDRQRGQ